MITKTQINRMVKIIAENYKPEKIILFGSYASGVPDEDSDVDLIIVKESKLPRIKRAREVRKYLTDFFVPKDILVYTRAEINEWKNVENSFITTAIREGRVLYER